MRKKIWNVKFVPGEPLKSFHSPSDGKNPRTRGAALALANELALNGWRVWVEHAESFERIYQSAPEAVYRSGLQRQSIVFHRVDRNATKVYLRLIDDAGAERRIALNGASNLEGAVILARKKGFEPTCSMSSHDWLQVGLPCHLARTPVSSGNATVITAG